MDKKVPKCAEEELREEWQYYKSQGLDRIIVETAFKWIRSTHPYLLTIWKFGRNSDHNQSNNSITSSNVSLLSFDDHVTNLCTNIEDLLRLQSDRLFLDIIEELAKRHFYYGATEPV